MYSATYLWGIIVLLSPILIKTCHQIRCSFKTVHVMSARWWGYYYQVFAQSLLSVIRGGFTVHLFPPSFAGKQSHALFTWSFTQVTSPIFTVNFDDNRKETMSYLNKARYSSYGEFGSSSTPIKRRAAELIQ